MQDDPLFDDNVIEVKPRKRRVWVFVVLALVVAIFLFGSPLIGVYVNSLWFSSLGFGDVYWYKFRLGGLLFAVFLVLTFLLMRLPFVALNRLLPQLTERPRVTPTSVEDLREINVLPFIYRPGVWLLAAIVAITSATNMSQEWSAFALYLNGSPAGATDPIFNRDVSFYLFTLPVLDMLSGWLTTVAFILFLVIAGASGYVWYVEKVMSFATKDTRRRATAAISAAGAFLALALAATTYLNRFDLLHARNDLFTGVSYTDANLRMPGLNVLMVALLIVCVLLAVNAFILKRGKVIIGAAGGGLVVWLAALVVIPQLVQSFSVKPNELAKESPYIQHNINMTRRAFAIDRFEETPFQPALTLTPEQIRANQPTIDNIRLWDPQALQSTFRQIQEIRTYYEFKVPDIDRYVINGKLRQVMLAAREMNVDQLPDQSRNWINQHLVYTHGYGVAMSTVNEFTSEGLPHLILKNMPVESDVPELKVTQPEIYFGEATNLHVYVNTKPQGSTPQPEFNYPAPGDTDSYSKYEGKAGIPVGGMIRQTALAVYLGDGTNLLLSDYITPDSRVIIQRNISDRVRQLAPFLLFESDPYLVISKEGKLYWIIDAFTHSDKYPYSSLYQIGNLGANYIRNSVKAVVDAYEGDVTFYVFEPDDPIIKSYQSIFPSLFRPRSDMPEDLLAHVRYPDLLAEVQARVYTLYHMTSPQTLYNREDLWAIPVIEEGGQDAKPASMQPYYVLMQLPGQTEERLEFVSILPFTPTGPGRNNMIGWMAARSDGEYYGQTLIFSFPKNITVNGPAQIKARVNQDAQLSGQLTLWNQQGSRVLRGNLQAIPLADSLLYIEPFYLQAVNSPLPELRQVAVATQDRLATGTTFDEALNKLFAELSSLPPAQIAQAGTPSQSPSQTPSQTQPAPPPTQQQPSRPATGDTARLLQQAQQMFSDYRRLTAEGKHRDAGEKLDQLGQTLNELARKQGGG